MSASAVLAMATVVMKIQGFAVDLIMIPHA